MKKLVLALVVLFVSLSVFAAYKPSVTAKQAPEPVKPVVSKETVSQIDYEEAKKLEEEFEGTDIIIPISSYEKYSDRKVAKLLESSDIDYIAQIVILPENLKEREKDKIIGLVAKPELRVIPYADREELKSSEKSELESAFKEIVSADNVRTIMPQLKKMVPNMQELVVTDLFYIRMVSQLEEYIAKNPDYIRMIFDLGVRNQSEQIYIAFRIKTENGYEWKVLDRDTVYINEDLTVTVDYDVIGPVSIIKAVKK